MPNRRFTPEQLQRIDQICTDAMDRPPNERTGYVEVRCTDDNSVHREVLRILSEVEFEAEAPIDTPLELANVFESEWRDYLGKRIGRFEIGPVVGEGGFGVVFRARQTEPVDRIVALKILKPGMDSRSIVRRFLTERQALAALSHPGIATILDGGVIPDGMPGAGRPYFVMELVSGPPITDFCDQELMSVSRRIELLLEVCEAVQHAHNRGIIHRDLKPSNILISLDAQSECDRPTIIDFGIAKVLQAEGDGAQVSLQTLSGSFSGTPAYMSPEQACGSEAGIDTRTDVYSLGVILYELLTGLIPFATNGKTPLEIARIITEQEAPLPSTRFASAATNADARARARSASSGALRRAIARDLDWITARCLTKAPEKRYETVHALASDLRCYLRSEPVAAGPPSWSYRLGKFTSRNRALVVSGSIIAATLALGVVGLFAGLLEVQRARMETSIAEEHRAAALQIDGLRDRRSDLENEGRYGEATRVALKELQVCEQLFGPESYTTAITEAQYASLRMEQARSEGGDDGFIRAADEYVRWARARYAGDVFRTTQSLAIAANHLVFCGYPKASESLARECMQIRVEEYPAGHENEWLKYNAIHLIGWSLSEQGQFEEAEDYLVDAARWMLQSPSMPRPEELDGADRVMDAVVRVIDLYEEWERASPEISRNEELAYWRAALAELRTRDRGQMPLWAELD